VRFEDAAVQALLAEWDDELGFSPKTVAEPGDFAPPHGIFLLAERNHDPVGCGGMRRLTDTAAEVKRLFVRPAERSQGIGRTLLTSLEQRAHELCLEELRLDTDGGDPAALALFRSAGFEPIADYNGSPYARHWFAKRLPPHVVAG
jgi:GNAT superfamily N-acetyltransferase